MRKSKTILKEIDNRIHNACRELDVKYRAQRRWLIISVALNVISAVAWVIFK